MRIVGSANGRKPLNGLGPVARDDVLEGTGVVHEEVVEGDTVVLRRASRALDPVFDGADGHLIIGFVGPLYRAFED